MHILATGDVAPLRPDMDSMFRHVRDILTEGDITVGQLECVISDRGEAAEHAKLPMRTHTSAARAIRRAGYDVVSFAGNHCMDWGRMAFTDTLAHARAAGLSVCGAGPDLWAARQPSVVKASGLSIATLAYSSILPEGYAATDRKPGCAPLRAHTAYEQIEHDQPGTPARVHTFPNSGDLANLVDDVRTAKLAHDIVLVSIHWGIHFVPVEIADYQRDYAYAAIDAGADAILGHHPHILKGVELYRGKPVFYSLGNFAIEQPQVWDPTILDSESFRHLMTLNPGMDPASLFVCPPDSHYSMIADLMPGEGGWAGIGYIPVYIDDQSVPRPLRASDPEFADHLAYMRDITAKAGMDTKFGIGPDGRVIACKPA